MAYEMAHHSRKTAKDYRRYAIEHNANPDRRWTISEDAVKEYEAFASRYEQEHAAAVAQEAKLRAEIFSEEECDAAEEAMLTSVASRIAEITSLVFTTRGSPFAVDELVEIGEIIDAAAEREG